MTHRDTPDESEILRTPAGNPMTCALNEFQSFRHEVNARFDVVQNLLLDMAGTINQIAIENRALFRDVETRQHGAASTMDELRGTFRDVAASLMDELRGTFRDVAASLMDELRWKFREVEVRELDVQRNLAALPDIVRDLITEEVNIMDGYNRYALDKLVKAIREQKPI